MAHNGLYRADEPLRNSSTTRSLTPPHRIQIGTVQVATGLGEWIEMLHWVELVRIYVLLDT